MCTGCYHRSKWEFDFTENFRGALSDALRSESLGEENSKINQGLQGCRPALFRKTRRESLRPSRFGPFNSKTKSRDSGWRVCSTEA
jgi:hypothetical protein